MDDYLTKPFDMDSYSVTTVNGTFELPPKEFEVLLFCAGNQGKILTKQRIYEEVWGEPYVYDGSNIMAVISRLCKKIEENPGRPRYIQAVKGNGNRRILAEKRELTAPLAYELNDIVRSYEDSISAYHRAEEMNRQLMTSLSHNARTPLTTGNGHLVRSLFKKKTHRPIDFRKER